VRVVIEMTIRHPYYVGTVEELDDLLEMLQDEPEMFLHDTPRHKMDWRWRIDET
jgi:hypothetical protein